MSVSAKEVHSHTRYAYKRFRFAAGYVVALKELYTKFGLLKNSGNFVLHRTNDVMTFRVECDITQLLVYWPSGFSCVCECPLPPLLQNHWPPLPALPKTNCCKLTLLDANDNVE